MAGTASGSHARPTLPTLGGLTLVGLLAVTGCAGGGTTGAGGAGRAPAVVPAAAPATVDDTSPVVSGADSASAATTESTTAVSTVPPPAVIPTTTPAPAPVVTVADTTPANRVAVSPLAVPLAAVGASDGGETGRVQQRLLELGFWLQRADGNYDLTTQQAVMAFQKYLGLEASGSVDDQTAALMTAMTLRAYGYSDAGTLAEIDKTRQLLFFVVDGRVRWVFNTSTGNGESYIEEDQNSPGTMVEGVSLTPSGLHKVERERPEGWWEGDLGQIYRPKYFVGGVAVHGSNSVPNYPASHGCVRVTTTAMDFIWESGIMPMQMPVWVHENPRQAFPTG
ncbi:MAG: L,D-transpeptidase family protein [Desertimonas sp.]